MSTTLNTSPQDIDKVLTRGVENVLPKKETLAKIMSERSITLYLGIDPTGNELHLGHSVPLRKLQDFAQLGHKVILLVGNGTVKIGDPTGRDESRPVLTDEEINANFANWQRQASKILDFSIIEVRYNADWLDKLSYSEMLKLMAKTTVQQLLERDMFQDRMAKGLPIHGHEIIYPLIQGYDSVAMDVDLEIGGNDQTFNMMMGRTLQKIYNNREKWVLTTPLIEGTDGRKMSQSYDNFVALTEPANDMYGKLMSIPDELILKYFKLLTDVACDELEAMQQAIKSGENPMNFKKKLALTITNDLHSESQARQAQQYFETTVQEGGLPNKIPEVKLDSTELIVLDLLKLCQPEESNAQLKRLCQQGGVKLMPQDEKLLDPNQKINFDDQQVIKVGKRNFYKLQLN